jgi:hypothetical protein
LSLSDPQTDFDTPQTNIPLAANAMRVITASVNGKSPFALFEDKRGSSTPFGVINQKRSAEWSVECYASTTTRGVAPDWADLLTSGGWELVSDRSAFNSALASGGTSTALNFDSVTNGDTLEVGDAVIIETGVGTDAYEIRRITNIATLVVTVTPALQNGPVDGARVYGAPIYGPKDDKDTTPDSLTVWAFNNNSADRASGAVGGTNSFTMGGDEAARVTFGGTARRDDRLVATTLGAQIVTGGLSSIDITVSTNTIYDQDLVDTNWTLTDPSVSGGIETVLVTAVDGTTWTVEREQEGTSDPGENWPVGTRLSPYQPSGVTYVGTPIPATSGQLIVEGSAFQAGSISVEVDQGIIYRENVHGDAYVVDGYVGGRRAVTATLEGWSFYDSTLLQALNARSRTTVSVLAQQGEAEGGIFAIEMPTFYFEEPDMDRGGDEVTVSMTGQAVGTAAETEIYLMIG